MRCEEKKYFNYFASILVENLIPFSFADHLLVHILKDNATRVLNQFPLDLSIFFRAFL